MELIKESRKLTKAINSIIRRGVQFDKDVHQAAVSCLYHGEQHGDLTLATRLVNGMPRSSRRKALIHWFTKHGMMTYKEKEQAFKMDKGKSKAWKLSDAESVPFWEFTEEKDPAKLTMEGLVKSVVNRVRKAKEDGRLADNFSIKKLEAELVVGLNNLDKPTPAKA